mmetsp:Transcript_15079/g.32635  ORF Transcript_15079/g.32635 Transcript_15079/m.32635 type:complete len:211 (-) Transcript_15079:1442-2074(-)
MVTAGNVQRKSSTTLITRTMNHRVSSLRCLGENEFDSLGCIKLGSNVNRLATTSIHIIHSLFVGAVDDLKSCNVIMRCCVVNWNSTDSILVNQCLRVHDEYHVDQESPDTGITRNHVKKHLSIVGVNLLCQMRILVQRFLHASPVLLIDKLLELLPLTAYFHNGLTFFNGHQLVQLTLSMGGSTIKRRVKDRLNGRRHGLVPLRSKLGRT